MNDNKVESKPEIPSDIVKKGLTIPLVPTVSPKPENNPSNEPVSAPVSNPTKPSDTTNDNG